MSNWRNVIIVKGPSKNVNIFMSVLSVHFFRPPPPKVYRPTFWGSKTKSHQTHLLYNNKILPIFEASYVTNDIFVYVLKSTDYS